MGVHHRKAVVFVQGEGPDELDSVLPGTVGIVRNGQAGGYGEVIVVDIRIRRQRRQFRFDGEFQREHGFRKVGRDRHPDLLLCAFLQGELLVHTSDRHRLPFLQADFHFPVQGVFFMRIEVPPGNLDLLGLGFAAGHLRIEPDHPEAGLTAHFLGRGIETMDLVPHIVIQDEDVLREVLHRFQFHGHRAPVHIGIGRVEVVEEAGVQIVIPLLIGARVGLGHERFHHKPRLAVGNVGQMPHRNVGRDVLGAG